jgi:hypothetical protein
MREQMTIRVQFNPKPGPKSRLDWDAWIEGDEEIGTGFGSSAHDALEDLAFMMEFAADRAARRAEVAGK